jgi:hypothetical protein
MNNKITFWKLIITISLVGLVLMSANISYAWTNPAANPPTGSGAINLSSGNMILGNSNWIYMKDTINTERAMFGMGGGSVLQINQQGSFNTSLNPNGGNVSIGTTGSGAKLDVSGDIRTISGSSGGLKIGTIANVFVDNNGLMNIGSGSAGITGIGFFPGGAQAVTILTNGNVGVGITNPNTDLETIGKLQVKGSSGLGPDGTGTAAGEGLHLTYVDASNTGRVSSYTDSATNGTLQLLGNDIQMFYGVGIQGLTLNSLGNIGIGVTSPDANYKITTTAGGIKAENNSATQPSGYFSNAGGGPAIQVGTGGFVTEARASDPSTTMVGQIWLRTDL